ncbi:MAG: DEAD/DEAH box helicase family protein, partial [bacterium]|nr:DEAD/DEAH box helicase family protein [bacterium]
MRYSIHEVAPTLLSQLNQKEYAVHRNDHRKIRKRLAAGIDALLAGDVELPHELYPYQYDALTHTRDWLLDTKGTPRGYIAHATGLGKTVLMAALMHACPDLRFLAIVPTKVLIEQTAPSITRFTRGLVGHVSSLNQIHDDDGNIVALPGHEYSNIAVTTAASLRIYAHALANEFAPHVVFWDECHGAYHPTAQASLAPFTQQIIIGLSATPDHLVAVAKPGWHRVQLENGRILYAPPDRLATTHFQTKIDERPVRWGIEEGWLAPFAWGRIAFDCALDSVPTRETQDGVDYDEKKLQTLMAQHWSVMTDTIVRLYEHGEYDLPNRQTFAVCPSVQAAEELAQAVHASGIPAACIHGGTPTGKRRSILKQFRNRQIKLITSVMVLREGWDMPNAEVCLMLRPTKSRVFYIQCIGRALRLDPDNAHKVALVLDPHFQHNALTPLSAPQLFALPGQEIAEGDMLIGPRRNRGRGGSNAIASPYLPHGAKPRIIVVDALSENEIEYWAGPDGTFEADGEVRGTVEVCAEQIQLPATTVRNRIIRFRCQSRDGRDRGGKMRPFYSLSTVNSICADLLKDIPKAGISGVFEIHGELWGTLPVLAITLSLSTQAVSDRVKGRNCRKKRGKDRRGKPRTFYALSDARDACSDLLSIQSQANHDGMFEADGEPWVMATAYAASIHRSADTVMERCVSAQCRSKKGKDVTGNIRTFYAVADVQQACADLLTVPQARDDGTFEESG